MTQTNRPPRPADLAKPIEYWRANVVKIGMVLISVGLILVMVVGVLVWSDVLPMPGGLNNDGEPMIVKSPHQSTVLLIRTDNSGQIGEGMTLFATDEEGVGQVLFIPVTTMMEIPGVGMDMLSLAVQYGGVELARAAIQNELEIRIDTIVHGTNDQVASFFQALGGAQIQVPTRLSRRETDGTVSVRFNKGKQYMNGPTLVDYLSFVDRTQTETDTFTRQQQVWEAMFDALSSNETRSKVFTPQPVNLFTAGSTELIKTIFDNLVKAHKTDELWYKVLPVNPIGSAIGSKDMFILERKRISEMINTSFAGSRPAKGEEIVPLQVLNGVGRPGIGHEISQKLHNLPVRIVLTENAETFNHPTTKIVVYSESNSMYKMAQRIQANLGVGEVLYSQQPQSLVKATIIVGHDFLDAHPEIEVEKPSSDPVEGVEATPQPEASATKETT